MLTKFTALKTTPLWRSVVDSANLLGFALFTRFVLLSIGSVSYAASSHKNPVGDLQWMPTYFFQVFSALRYADVTWYLQIADEGYTERPFSVDEKANWAFYPLWPLLMRWGSHLVGGDSFLAGVILANLIFLIAVIWLYQLMTLDVDRKTASLTVILAIAFPASYFYSRPGPEALFLLVNVLALWCARKQHWLWSGVFAACATVTRLQGILLVFPLVFLYYQHYRKTSTHNLQALSLLLIPLAYGAFLWHLHSLTGNFLASFGIQQAWDSSLSWPFLAMAQYLASPVLISYYGWDLSPVSVLFMVLCTVLGVAIARHPAIPREYLIYTVLHLFLILSRNNLQGTLRYMLPVFPLFLVLALWIQPRPTWHHLTLYGFTALQVAYFMAFIHQFNFAQT